MTITLVDEEKDIAISIVRMHENRYRVCVFDGKWVNTFIHDGDLSELLVVLEDQYNQSTA